MLLDDARRWRGATVTKRELEDERPSNAALVEVLRCKVFKCCWMLLEDDEAGRWRNATSWLQVPDTTERLLKYYPRPPCVPSFVKSRMLRPLQMHFLLFQQIFFVLVCIHPGNARMPPRVFASGPKPCGATIDFKWSANESRMFWNKIA